MNEIPEGREAEGIEKMTSKYIAGARAGLKMIRALKKESPHFRSR